MLGKRYIKFDNKRKILRQILCLDFGYSRRPVCMQEKYIHFFKNNRGINSIYLVIIDPYMLIMTQIKDNLHPYNLLITGGKIERMYQMVASNKIIKQ